MMSEAEVKEKWCPMARKLYITSRETGACASANRPVKGVTCIASECAWWKWSIPYDANRHTPRFGQCGAINRVE